MKRLLMLILGVPLLFAPVTHAQRFQQDSWYLESTASMYQVTGISSGALKCIAAGPTGTWFIGHQPGNNAWRLHAFNRQLQWQYSFPTSASPHLASLTAFTVGTNALIYATRGNNISVFDLQGNVQRHWAADQPVAVDYGPDGNIYVAEATSRFVKVFQDNGTTGVLLRTIGGAGTLPYQFKSDLKYLRVTRAGYVYASADMEHKRYTLDGGFVRDGDSMTGIYTELCDGLLRKGQDIVMPDLSQSFGTIIFADAWHGVDMGDGRLVAIKYTGADRLLVWRRAYLEPGAGHPPLPEILSVSQRAGTTLVDVDYRIWDDDSTNVDVAAIGIHTGTNLVGNLIPMRTYAEGTGTNLGGGRIPGERYRLTWNVAADWPTNFGNLRINLLSRDEAPGLENVYITLPAGGTNSALTISRNPLRSNEVLNALVWLVATNDPGVVYSNRAIYSDGGALLVASNNVVSTQGINFVLARYQLRLATYQEYQRAAQGNAGVTNRWTPNLKLQPDALPNQVNEYGFNPGPQSDSGSYYVVPLP